MATRVEPVGVHPVEADEPCHLVELLIYDVDGPFDIGSFTQETPGEPEHNWQVPWDEVVLDGAGEAVISDPSWSGVIRIAFFFHCLNQHRPLTTPFGDVVLPLQAPRPQRLASLQYEAP
jgi:hypothetical protein